MTTTTEALRQIVADVDAPGHTVRSVRPESITAARAALESGGWTRCEDALPPMLEDDAYAWRLESEWVLVRTQPTRGYPKGEISMARYCTYPDADDGDPRWVLQGRDGYELDGVIEWKVIE